MKICIIGIHVFQDFSDQIKEKSKQHIDRDLLVSVLKKQNNSICLRLKKV